MLTTICRNKHYGYIEMENSPKWFLLSFFVGAALTLLVWLLAT